MGPEALELGESTSANPSGVVVSTEGDQAPPFGYGHARVPSRRAEGEIVKTRNAHLGQPTASSERRVRRSFGEERARERKTARDGRFTHECERRAARIGETVGDPRCEGQRGVPSVAMPFGRAHQERLEIVGEALRSDRVEVPRQRHSTLSEVLNRDELGHCARHDPLR